ncbi:MAG: valine--tRNA ligase [Phycisphaeraceae bacterium]|nr:valine--tRNA ligase [Phycisphaeraceae bacterium]
MSDAATTQKVPAGELPKQFRPRDHEDRVRQGWEAARAFHADPDRVLEGRAKPYAILIPPPNVTAALHLGHALNNTLQDVLARVHRMKGYETLWMPGTDHAGIATQTVVEKRVKALEGKSRADFAQDGERGRAAFVERIQAFKDEYEVRITEQLKRMGCSCDWERQRFTMDEVCARAVREAFFQLFKAGLISRGKRLVNWDPVTQTALADDEVEMEEIEGFFYSLRYPLVHRGSVGAGQQSLAAGEDAMPVTWNELAVRGYPGADEHPGDAQAWVTVATTRPETYLGDTAVAMNPKDPRAKALRGLFVELPLVGRVIPVIEDDYVVMPEALGGDASDPKAQFATGFLKVTPGHDPNDYEIGRRHELPIINIMAPDASISDQHGWNDVGNAHLFVGKSREEARMLVVREFEARGWLERKSPYRHSVGHSYRSHVPIEPYLSDQWYVKVTDDSLRGAALRAMAGEQRSGGDAHPTGGGVEKTEDGLRFFPERYAKTFETWHENIRDWCISRQLWWGHRIPVWSLRAELPPDTLPFPDWPDPSDVGVSEFETEYNERLRKFAALIGCAGQLYAKCEWREGDYCIDVCAATEEAERVFTLYSKPDGSTWQLHAHLEPDAIVALRRIEEMTRLNESLDPVFSATRDPDVLDTWFSSALWPLSTMGWPDADAAANATGIADFPSLLPAFNPTNVLVTGRDIITLWVSRMVMFNRWFTDQQQNPAARQGEGRLPFHHVYINPIIQDGHGQRMSKSLGNGVDPLDIIESHGADALRYVLCQVATSTQDIRLPVDLVCPHTGKTFSPKFIRNSQGRLVPAPIQECPADPTKKMVTAFGLASGQVKPSPELPLARNTSAKFDIGRNFATKLWNAARFTLSMLTEPATPVLDPASPDLGVADRWMLSRLAAAIDAVDVAVARYEFSVYAGQVYDLLWRDFCDWYLEIVKPTAAHNPAQRAVLRVALDAMLRLLHPIMPFVTEVIYEHIGTLPTASVQGLSLDAPDRAGLLCRAGWPRAEASLRDQAIESTFARMQELITAIREVRAQHQVHPRRPITLHVSIELHAELRALGVMEMLRTLAGVERIETVPPAGQAAEFTFGPQRLAVSNLADAVDAEAEKSRLEKLIADLNKSVAALSGRLANPGYAQRAPAHLVQETRDELERKKAELAVAIEAMEKQG